MLHELHLQFLRADQPICTGSEARHGRLKIRFVIWRFTVTVLPTQPFVRAAL